MKKILMLLAVAGITSVASAQNTMGYGNADVDDKYQVFTNKFWDNWFFSFGGGGEMLLGNSDVHASFSDRISPTFNAALGKWFTPGLGLRLQYSGFQSRGYTKDVNNPYVDGTINSDGFYKQKFKYMNVHGDILFNLSSMLGGYNPDRIYEFIPYLGAGFSYNYTKPHAKGFTLNGGLINRFRLSSAWDLNIEMSIAGMPNKFDGELGGKMDVDGVVAASVGFTYKFPKRTFDKSAPAPRPLISEAELRNLRSRMNQMAAENQNLRSELADATKPVTVVQNEMVDPDVAPRSAFFKIGSAVLDATEKINLGFIADQMQQYPNMKFTVKGYADSATGSAQTNQRLSEKRANAVVDELVNKHGINRSRFVTIEGMGGVAKYEKPYLNRMTLIEMVK